MMTNILDRKTFKVQFEISIEMDEIQAEDLPGNMPVRSASFLKHLQHALLKDEKALLEVMRSRIIGELQEYIDYMSVQDDQPALLEVVETLGEKDRRFLRLHRDDFEHLTRPLRVSSLKVHLDDSRIEEKIETKTGEFRWRAVWRDLLQGTRLGKLLEKLSFPTSRAYTALPMESVHYLLLDYVTQHLDGVHVEGSCTCDRSFQATGEDEGQALEALWAAFQAHHPKFQRTNTAFKGRPGFRPGE